LPESYRYLKQTETFQTSSDPKDSQKLKELILKGMVGAVSLVGAMAIPLIVQQVLPPTPV